jgi:hypothetical protein
MKTLPLILLLAAGCANFRTVQTDESTTSPEGVETRKITTTATARTFAASKQALAQWKATQSDKTQGASVGQLNQEADASDLTRAIGEGIAKGLIKGIAP